MERLTKILGDGQVAMDCQSCELQEKFCCTALGCRDRLKDRLAAYEDTGLTPEEVSAVAEMFKGEPYIPISRIAELVQAEREDRLVVLPCKKGDELWSRCSLHDIHAQGVFGLVVSSIFVLDGCVRIKTGRYGEYGVEEIGKTIFRTREEAEAALEKSSLGEGVQRGIE